MRAFLPVLVLASAACFSARAETPGSNAPPAPGVEGAQTTRSCEVPGYLTASDSVLAKVADRVKAGQIVNILVIGSGSSTLNGSDGASAAYPARLQFYLAQRLSRASVHVETDLHMRQTAEEVVESLPKTVAERKPALVVWQTGTVDALKSVDTDDFRTAITDGVTALKAGGADVVLVNPQYNPRMETMVSVSSYLDTMRVVAQEADVPLFDRFSIMRRWTDVGDFDLSANTHTAAMAKSVHDCIGRALADTIVEALRLNSAELRIQK